MQMGLFTGFTIHQEIWSLHHKRKAIELFGLINNDEAEALRLFTIHEERLSFITMWWAFLKTDYNYPQVLITPGVTGERDNTF